MPKHNLLVKNLKAKWNNVNRNVVYMLYEIYYRTKRLRHNLSSQALKEYDLLTDQFVQSQFLANNTRIQGGGGSGGTNQAGLSNGQHMNHQSATKTSTSEHNRKHYWTTTTTSMSTTSNPSMLNESVNGSGESNSPFEDLLSKLDAERSVSLDVYCDEQSSANHSTSANFNDLLYGPNAIRMSDVVDEHVFIEFINSQIKLSLDESEGDGGGSATTAAAVDAVQASLNELAGPGNKTKSQKRNGASKQGNYYLNFRIELTP